MNCKESINDYPDDLSEDEMRIFIYLRACVFLKEKPIGSYDGNAGICAEVLQNGGSLMDAYNAGAEALYVALLSSYKLDADLQREIIDSHIPF